MMLLAAKAVPGTYSRAEGCFCCHVVCCYLKFLLWYDIVLYQQCINMLVYVI